MKEDKLCFFSKPLEFSSLCGIMVAVKGGTPKNEEDAKMTKYEILTGSFELRFGTSRDTIPAMSAEEIFSDYQDLQAKCPEIKASFETINEAREEFSAYYKNFGTNYAQAGGAFWLLMGEVAWIEENEYDEDGEFDQGGAVHDFSAAGFEPEN